MMTSKERVRAAINFQKPDRIPAAFEAVGTVQKKLMNHYGFSSYDQLLEKFQIDIVSVTPKYIGPPLKEYKNKNGQLVRQNYWGFEEALYETDVDTYVMASYFPFHGAETVEDVMALPFPDPDCYIPYGYAGIFHAYD